MCQGTQTRQRGPREEVRDLKAGGTWSDVEVRASHSHSQHSPSIGFRPAGGRRRTDSFVSESMRAARRSLAVAAGLFRFALLASSEVVGMHEDEVRRLHSLLCVASRAFSSQWLWMDRELIRAGGREEVGIKIERQQGSFIDASCPGRSCH